VVYYAPISSTGVGTWQATTSYPLITVVVTTRNSSTTYTGGMAYAYCEIPGSGGGYYGGGGLD